MRIPIAAKIGVWATVLVTLVSIVVCVIAWRIGIDLLMEHEVVDLRDETELSGREFLNQISVMREDAFQLAEHPAVRGLVMADQQSDSDPATVAALRQQLFDAVKTAYFRPSRGQDTKQRLKPYLRIRLIGGAEPREILSVSAEDVNRAEAPPESSSASLPELYDTARDAKTYRVFLGDVKVDQDTSQSGTKRAMLPSAAPVYDGDGRFYGVVSIDLDFTALQEELLTSGRHLAYLTDSNGTFLVHPDRTRRPDYERAVAGEQTVSYLGKVQDDPQLKDELSKYYGDSDAARIERGFAEKGTQLNGLIEATSEDDEAFRKIEFELLWVRVIDCKEQDWKDLRALFRRMRQDPENRVLVPDPDRMTNDSPRLPFSAPVADAEAVAQLDALERELTAFNGGGKLKTQFRKTAKTFHASFIVLPYEPGNPDRWFGMVRAFSQQELDGDTLEQKGRMIWGIVILVMATIAVTSLFTYMGTRSLKQVTVAADHIAGGNFNVELPLQRRDELGDLARGFEHMIGEVKARELKIHEREARLRMIVDSAAEGIITVDVDGTIRSGNPASIQMFGFDGERLSGSPVQQLFDEATADAFDAARHRLLNDCSSSFDIVATEDSETLRSRSDSRGKTVSVFLEGTGRRRDGTQFPVEVSLSSVKLPERRIFTLIARDITERKQAEDEIRTLNEELEHRVLDRTAKLEKAMEELQQAHERAQELNRAKDAFLASVSHELRNPLNQVSGFCQLLELSDLDDEQRADVKKIRVANSQLLALINDILDYQKIIMGGITLEPESIDVVELLGEVRDAMSVQANENRNQLYFEWCDDIGQVWGDRQRLRQVLLNLVGNACKFTNDGSVSVLAQRKHAGDTQWIELSVKDTGRGMTPEELAKLFRPFNKLSSKKGNKAGTGLGLVISRGFCQLMRGDIGVESEFGKGSTFTIRLPATQNDRVPDTGRAPTAESSGAQPPEPALTSSSIFRAPQGAAAALLAAQRANGADPGRLVLVIDDDRGVREMMERHLTSHGFKVVTAADGFEGLELARELKPAVITLDAIMPDLDGWAVLGALKAGDATSDIPVIMVTVMDKEERGFALGATEFLAKPIDWGNLTSTLARYTGNKRERSILVVDDDPPTREILRRNLESDGWSVLEAQNGAEALEMLAIERPAAVILDLMMPVMDGFEFILRYSQVAEWLSIPVLVLTAKDPTPDERRRLEGQVVRVIRKGDYTHDELMAEIHRRVDSHLKTGQVAGEERS